MDEKTHEPNSQEQNVLPTTSLPPASRREQSKEQPLSRRVPAHAFQRVLHGPGASSAVDILSLQQTIGNQAVQRLLARTARLGVIQPKRDPSLQAPTAIPVGHGREPASPKENTTGLPDELKAGIESLSGLSLDDVQVHHNSSQPAQMQALAYTQGTEIHVGPGQEEHLAHEAWHVVQQAQGRVKPTMHMKGGVPINDDVGLETEADVMGAKAAQTTQKQNVKIESSITTQRKSTGFNNILGTHTTQLRKLRLGNKKVTNFDNAMKNKEFKDAITKYFTGYDEARVRDFARQLFSSEGEDISSLDLFMIELQYDLETKSMDKEPLKLQERYMTEYGWKRAANDPSKAAPSNTFPKLRLYRTMSIEAWKKIVNGDYSVLVSGHIGDFKQALKYFIGKSSDSKVMVEFTLKAGAEKTLFSTSLALPIERSRKLQTMAGVISAKGNFPVANNAEGTSSEAIGIKSESEGEAGFSIGIGGGDVAKIFQALVESVALKSVGERVSNVDSDSKKPSRIEADANLLLHVNNCLINAISFAARRHEANLMELIAIRTRLNNYGEMLVASLEVVQLIQAVLGIPNPITVAYSVPDVPSEDFPGVGDAITIYHLNGNHFTHEPNL